MTLCLGNVLSPSFCLNFCVLVQVEADVAKQLLEPFTPDDTFLFGPQSALTANANQMNSNSKESLSFDEVLSYNIDFNVFFLQLIHLM